MALMSSTMPRSFFRVCVCFMFGLFFPLLFAPLVIDVIIPLRRVSTAQRQNTQHSQHQTYYQPRYPTRKTVYVRRWAVRVVLV